MMWTFCLLLVFGVAYGAAFNTDRCLLDNDHACKNYTSARQCAATDECRENFWNCETIENDLCTMCKEDVGKIQTFLEKKSTKAGVYNDLIALCGSVPFKTWSDECKKLVEQDFEMIYDDIIALVDPSTVCRALGLCKSMNKEQMAQEMMKILPEMLKHAVEKKQQPMLAAFEPVGISSIETDSCSDCEAFLFDFKNMAAKNKKVVNDWKVMLSSACDSLGDGADIICKRGVDMFAFEFLVQQSKNKANAKSICKSIMMCDSFNKKRVGDVCQDCKTFFTDWQKMLRENQTLVDEIVSTVAEIYCFQKPHYMKKCQIYVSMVIKVLLQKVERECKSLVKVHLREYLDQLVRTDVGEICTRLEFCQQRKHKKPELTGVVGKIIDNVRSSLPKRKAKVGGDHCTDCKAFITDLQGVITNNQSLVKEVIDLVKDQCSQLGELEEVCKLEIENNYRSLLDQFKNADVDTICTTIMMCTESASRRPPSNGDVCSDCEAFFGDWQDIITNNKSVIDELNSLIEEQCSDLGPEFEKVEKKLQSVKDSVCASIPFFSETCDEDFDTLSTKIMDYITKNCDVFVKEYLPQLWDLIADTDPSEICATLYLCGAKKTDIANVNTVQSIIRQATPLVMVKDNVDVECGACQFVIQEVEKLIEENRTEEAIEQALEEVCILFGEDIRAECKKFVVQYGPEITDFLLQELSSLEICVKLGLCNSTSDAKMNKVEIPVLCETCEFVITFLKKELLNNYTKEEIEAALDKVCSLVPTRYRAECDKLVKDYGVELIDILFDVALSPKEVCRLIGLCSILEEQQQIVAKVQDDIMCDACLAVMKELDSLLEDNATEAEIKDALDKVCDILGSYKDECLTIVNEYTDTIIQLIIEEADPNEICSALKLCAKKWNEKVKMMKVKDDVGCEVCEAVMTELDKILEENSTEDEIKSALEEVCTVLGSYEKECKTFVDKYADAVVQLIVQGANPKEVCTLLTLCPKTAKNTVKDDMWCDVCEAVMTELDQILEENSTEDEIKSALEEVCTVLGSYEMECKTFVDKYADTIVQLIVEGANPKKVCTLLTLCSKNTKTNDENVLCEVCEAAMTQLDKMLSDPKTVDKIKAALDQVCSYLGEYKDQCVNMVTEYTDEIVDLITKDFTPQQICAMLKLCAQADVPEIKVQDDVLCDVCEQMMKELDNLIKDNKTEESIRQALEEVCSLLPAEFGPTCDGLVDQFSEEIVRLLLSELDPKQVCTELKLCPGKLPKKNNLQKSSVTCAVCEAIMFELKKMLDETSTEKEILEAVEKVCSLVPKSFGDVCLLYVKDYGPGVISILVKDFDPDHACAKLGTCPARQMKIKKEAVNFDTCSICKVIIKDLDSVLKENATKEEVIHALEKQCDRIYKFLQKECDEFVDEYAPIIFEYIDKIGDPNFLCEKMRLCPSKAQNLLGVDPCTFGPSYWCNTMKTARECNAVSHCRNHIWN